MLHLTPLLPLVACVSYVTAACEPPVVRNIEALRKGIDDSGVLKIVGDWDVVYAAGSSTVPGGFSNSTCQVSTFFKDGSGKQRVAHNGVVGGGYLLQFKDGKELVIDPQTGKPLRYSYVVYRSPGYAVAGFYTCSVSGPDVSAGSVLVAKQVLQDPSTSKHVQAAKQALASVGLVTGTPLTACSSILT